jgi:hypothetical protein
VTSKGTPAVSIIAYDCELEVVNKAEVAAVTPPIVELAEQVLLPTVALTETVMLVMT